MKTVADIKRAFVVGAKFHTMYHKDFTGSYEDGKPVYGDKDLGVRKISIVKSTQVAFATKRSDGKIVDSWIEFPKKSEVIFNSENSFTILDHDNAPMLTYTKV